MNCDESPCSNPVTPLPAAPRYDDAPTPFHPAPYDPSAKIPRATAPNQPQYPCTDTAPHGSSTFSTRSFSRTPPHTIAPASRPIMMEAGADTKAHGAVMATNPASIPLHAIVTSGLPKSMYHTTS